eukprot:scaffold27984_cov113-Isochrysis_galbana.AAC.3
MAAPGTCDCTIWSAASASNRPLCLIRLSRYPTPNCALRKSTDPTHRREPSAMIAILSARSSASSRKWVVSTMVRPSRCSRSRAQIARRECGSIPEVGSSRKSGGRPGVPPAREGHPVHQRVNRGGGGAAAQPLELRVQLEVLPHRQLAEEDVLLRADADGGADLRHRAHDGPAVDVGVASVRGDQPGQHRDGGGLAGAVGPQESGRDCAQPRRAGTPCAAHRCGRRRHVHGQRARPRRAARGARPRAAAADGRTRGAVAAQASARPGGLRCPASSPERGRTMACVECHTRKEPLGPGTRRAASRVARPAPGWPAWRTGGRRRRRG